MTCPPLWRKPNPLFPPEYPLVLESDGKNTLKSDGFLRVCHQIPGERFWRGSIVVHGQWYHFAWPDLEVAAFDLHRLWEDSTAVGVVAAVAALGVDVWEPATWFDGHLPRSIKQKTGRPSIAGSRRLSLEGNVLTLQLAQSARKQSHSPWNVFWNGKRVVANKGFEWSDIESAQQAAKKF
jgi:hypothetical protein